MTALHTLSRTVFFTILLGLLAEPSILHAQNQTNDPLVDEQQYLFDVHRVNQAWNYTTGSSDVTVGLYSMLGFIQNHEDLAGSRLKSPVGSLLKPKLDVASQMAGVIGATTGNGVGMAGIDHAAQLQSYSALRSTDDGGESISPITVDRPDGGTETYFLDLHRFNEIVEQGRSNGVDVHLFSFGLPSADPTKYPTGDPVPDFKDPLNLPDPPDLPNNWWDLVKELAPGARKQATETNTVCSDIWGLTFLLGSCPSRKANPYQQFSEILGTTVSNDGAVVVGAAGDLSQSGDVPPIGFNPGLRDRYAVTVGGVQFNDQFDLVEWDRTRPAAYVDVAGFAKNVVGLSGAGSSQYSTGFTSTAASASIGAGVASLLKAENTSLTGEDVEEILRRTARDAGAPGEDDATGAGAIDAGAALSYVRNNDVQRSTQTVGNVTSDQVVEEDVDLRGSGYWDYVGASCGGGRLEVTADLHKFKARVPFSQTFTQSPDAWVRWGQSNGVKSTTGEGVSWFMPFQKELRVVDADGRGLTVEGYYWVADFYNRSNQRCGNNIRIPKFPEDFNIGYTAVGTEGPPPVKVTLSGPGQIDSGEQGTWTASTSGGSGSTSYEWEYQPAGGTTWYNKNCTGSSCSHSFVGNYENGGIRVTATSGSESDQATVPVIVLPSCTGRICVKSNEQSKRKRIAIHGPNLQPRGNRSTELQWTAGGALPTATFVVEHRSDSTAEWSKAGTVATADSVGTADKRRGASYHYRAENLSVGTHQFRLRLQREGAKTQTSRAVSAEIRLTEAFEVETYPNPVRSRATIELAVREKQDVRVAVYDVLGRQVTTLHDGPLPAQETTRLSFNASQAGLSSGTYFVRVRGEAFAETRRLTVVR